MANVLNKLTCAYLQSVNTPDYPETDWLINPDMSAVLGVAPCYWVIDSTTTTVQEIIDYDAEENPIYGDVTSTTYSVREMTIEEKAEYDSHNQPITSTTKLNDGTPSYVYRCYVISVNVQTLTFSVKTAGAKKFAVPFSNSVSEYKCDRNRLITSMSMMGTCASDFDVVAKINGVEAGRWTVSNGQRRVPNLEIALDIGQTLSIAIDSTTDVANPVVMADTSYMN